MKLQQLIWLGLIGVVVVAAGETRVYAHAGAPSQATLSEMGLSGLVVMNDDQGLAVRGEGFKGGSKSSASVYGNSYASFSTKNGTATSKNGYKASGSHSASGANISFAGDVSVNSSSKGDHTSTKVKAQIVFAGGASIAHGK